VNETPPENWASENGMAVASPVTTSILLPRRRELSDSANFGVNFDSRDALHLEPQQVRCETRSRSKLKDILSKVGARKDPRHSLLDGLSPSGGTAQPMVQVVHASPLQDNFRLAQFGGCLACVLPIL